MAEISTKRVSARITGLVQGVFYRASTRRQARALGVSGWVRNTHDGAVELAVQGPSEAVDRLIAWCREGPPAARVERVEVTPVADLVADEADFDIRYA